jgi:hypothetical protein
MVTSPTLRSRATDTPARRGLERDISGLLQDLDAVEIRFQACSSAERQELATERDELTGRLVVTVGALRALRARRLARVEHAPVDLRRR